MEDAKWILNLFYCPGKKIAHNSPGKEFELYRKNDQMIKESLVVKMILFLKRNLFNYYYFIEGLDFNIDDFYGIEWHELKLSSNIMRMLENL